MPERVHGDEPRGLTNTPRQRSYDGRFGRMFGGLADQPAHAPVVDDALLTTLAAGMADDDGPGSDNVRIPAGYVYLGQFIDHDVTFDPTSQLQRRNDVDGLLNFRTPRFDLDSVYGSGPDDEPFQYDRNLHDGFGFLIANGFDLPRNSEGRALSATHATTRTASSANSRWPFSSCTTVYSTRRPPAPPTRGRPSPGRSD